jgi:serine/threonine protein kinase/Tol biopolymer transport system component
VSTLSHYEILERLGEGGMGVVSLARDIRLGRLVALKQLRSEACCGGLMKERFLAEARTASSLNHPNIVTIYDIDSDGGSDIIAMEYVKGKRLDEVIHHRSMPVPQALEYAVQIAAALEAAQQAGIVHRDIKPANIMVSENGLVKVLDFGLAKLVQRAQMSVISDTVSADGAAPGPVSITGEVSGTLYYMSPEQAEGRDVDSRTDIFAFGCVMYEMLTGRRAFSGDSAAAILTAILRDEPPPISQFAPGVPPELERIVRRCVRKDPKKRWQQMPDLRVALEEIRDEVLASPTPLPDAIVAAETPHKRPNWMLGAFAVVVLAAVGAAWWRNFHTAAAPSPAKSAISRFTSDSGLTSFPAISPDGSLVAYASDRAGEGNLDVWVQQLAGGEPIRLTRGKADEYEPVFSPDGSRIAFRSEADGGGLYLVSALGGEPRRLVQSGRSARFSPDGNTLLFAIGSPGVGGAFTTGVSSIYSVGINGGEPRRLAADFTSALHPNWSADGKHILFVGSHNDAPTGFDLWDWPVDGNTPVATGVLKALRAQGFTGNPEPFAVYGDSIIMSMRIGDTVNLWRVRLSRNQTYVASPPEQITFGTGFERLPSVSRDGRIVFSAGQENSDIWELPIDASRGEVKGEARQLTRDAAEDFFPSLSADGSRIAFISRRSGNSDVWTLNTATGKTSLLLSTPASEIYPKLSKDGTLAAFVSMERDRPTMYTMSTASGVATRICEACGMVRDLTGDGTKIIVQVGPPAHIGILDVATRAITALYRHPQFQTYAPKLSADEKWAAFQAVEQPTTRTLYVAPYRTNGPVPPQEWIKITDGKFLDRNPVWSPDGGLLYFLSERDTFRCIWGQRLNPATHRPVGEPFPVAHFHDAVRSLMNIDGPGQIGMSVGPGRLVYAAGELKGNIWFAQLR